jgi:hypothetical protein
MTDLNKIIGSAKSIERILTEQFGGSGRGMREKLDSARYPIPEPLKKRIAYLARVRNRCVHEEGYELEDTEDYVRKCESVCRELQQAHAIAVRVTQQRANKGSNAHPRFLVAGGVVLALAAAWWAVRSPASPAPQTESPAEQLVTGPVTAPAPATVEPRRAATGRATMATGTHQGIGNDVLAVDAVQFGYAKGSFHDLEPTMSVTVRNTSDRIIASARVDGRLYIGGEAAPLVDTATDDKPLFLFFGERGLAPGESRKESISLFGDDRWSLPDAINADKRALVLRIAQVSDGREKTFGAGPRAWPVVPAAVRAAAAKTAAANTAAAAKTSAAAASPRTREGGHTVFNDSRLEVGRVTLSARKNGFGAREPGIVMTVTNHAGTTLSAAAFHLQLFIKGESTPVIDSDQNAFSKDVSIYFGDAGLLDGKTAETELYLNTFHDSKWKAPDVMNAIASGNAQLVLRVTTLTDGRQHKL